MAHESHIRAARQFKICIHAERDIQNINDGDENDYATNTMNTDQDERTCARRARVEGE